MVAERRCSARGRAPRASPSAGSPRQSEPILSISSISSSGLDDSASRIERMIVPGIEPMYVRRWPRISDSSRTPPTDMRTNLRPSARAIDWPSEVLPTPGGPTKQRICPETLLRSFGDREVLDDPLLDLVEVEVVVVEHLARVLEVEVVLGVRAPRQRRDPLEVGADHAVLGRRLRQALEPRQLAVGRLPHVVGQRQRLDAARAARRPRPARGPPRRARPGSP